MTSIRGSSVFGFYFGSILVVSSGHCCVYFFRVFFGVRGFTCGSLLFLSFVFVRGASHGFVGGGIVLFNSCGNSASADVCGEFSFPFFFFTSAFLFCCFDPSVSQCRLSNEI